MSWNKLAPIAKTTGRPMASASVVVNKDGVPKISLILSASLKEEFGDPERCDVSAGDGENAGALLLEFSRDGAFELRNFVHGGARLFMPVPEGMSDAPANNAPCTLAEKVPVSQEIGAPTPAVVIRLPMAAWTEDRKVRVVVRSDPVPPPAGPTAATVGNGAVLDVVEYLKTKGVTVARLAGERFMLSGETVTIGGVLNVVNKHREAAGLTPLSRVQVR